ncbi:MAG: HU family DNA-binding protein [Clostridium sp.]|uniref:HU family DNA-binding protein n=1 Tax=Clostridium sp. TaxID=1506 RepID=UPI003F2FF8B2
MTKSELVKGLSEKLGVSKKEIEGGLAFLDDAIKFAASIEGKTKLGKFITVEKVSVPRKEGECNHKPYVTEAHDEIVIKRTAVCKRV